MRRDDDGRLNMPRKKTPDNNKPISAEQASAGMAKAARDLVAGDDLVGYLPMKGRDRCSGHRPGAGCLPARDILTVQPFPSGGRLGANLGLPLPLLTARIGQAK